MLGHYTAVVSICSYSRVRFLKPSYIYIPIATDYSKMPIMALAIGIVGIFLYIRLSGTD